MKKKKWTPRPGQGGGPRKANTQEDPSTNAGGAQLNTGAGKPPAGAGSPASGAAKSLLDSALEYASRGWPVIPVHTIRPVGICTCGNKDCKSPGKHPMTPHGVKDGSTDPAVIRDWWTRWPLANIGICTGKTANIVVLDVDPRHGGTASLAKLVKKHGALPVTTEVKTGSGGSHFYFSHPVEGEIHNATNLRGHSGLDVRAKDGYIIAPPALHKSGNLYAWVNPPGVTPPAPLPNWLLDLMKTGPGPAASTASSGRLIPNNKRKQVLTRIARDLHKQGMGKEAIEAVLMAENRTRCATPYSDEEVKTIVNRECSYPVQKEDEEPEEDLSWVQAPMGPGLLRAAIEALHKCGLAGEDNNAGLVYLAFSSRTQKRPINVFVGGPSSGGKSELVRRVSELFPKRCVYRMTTMSSKALFYSKVDLQHCFIWVGENDGLGEDPVLLTTIRAVAWEGHLSIDTVDTSSGKPVGISVTKPGPTGVIMTGVGENEDQLATRMFPIEVSDTPAQSAQIVRAQAQHWDDPDSSGELKPWRKLAVDQEQADRVFIPYKEWLADRMPKKVTRIRRDFPQFLRLIETHALLERKYRARDAEGRIVADLADYATVEALLHSSFSGVHQDGLTPAQRDAVEIIKDLTEVIKRLASEFEGVPKDCGVTGRQVATELDVEPSNASRRLKRPLKLGYVINTEARKGYPAKYVPGEPLPRVTGGLPSPEELAKGCGLSGRWVDPITGKLCQYPPEDDCNGATGDSGPSPVGSKPVAPPIAGAGSAAATPPATPESFVVEVPEAGVAALHTDVDPGRRP